MELNANPSLSIYVDKELPNGDIEQTLCELDKYVKSMLISDTLKVISADDEDEILEYGCLKRILPCDEAQFDELFIYSEIEILFERLAGTKC